MGKLPVALLLALALWIGWTVYEEGPDEAFGGFSKVAPGAKRHMGLVAHVE